MMDHNWSPQQVAFLDEVEHGRGSIVLEAVAGAGKTTTVLAAVDRLSEGCAILAYNKKIADEVKEKLQRRGIDFRKAEAGTVHSFGFRAYRKAFPDVETREYKVDDLLTAMVERRNDAAFTDRVERYRPKLLALVSLAKQRAVGVLCGLQDRAAWEDIIDHFDLLADEDDCASDENRREWVVRTGMRLLEASNQQTGLIDFDDMVYLPLVHRVRFWRFGVVFVDEAQDTNPARRALVRALVRPGGRVIAVGDPHQAIYGFTGADADSLDLIARDFNARRMPLTVTYRCPKAVVAFAHQWVSHIQAHPTAPEGEVVPAMSFEDFAGATEHHHGQSAVLCRNVAPLVSAAFRLISSRVACKIEGREVGVGLEKLATRWKRARTVNALEKQLEDYQERQTTKLLARRREAAAQAVEDQCEALRVIIAQVRAEGRDQVTDVVAYIRELFADRVSGILTLSTVHKSKGREWQRVYWLDRVGTCPSRYARQDWQKAQEDNLCYVAATRAMHSLIELSLPAKKEVRPQEAQAA